MSPRPTDYQRKRVYDLEEELWGRALAPLHRPLTLGECESIASRMANRPIHVRDGRGCVRAYSYGPAEIGLPRWARRLDVIAHEVAHCIDAYKHHPVVHGPRITHGPKFVGTYLALAVVWGLGSADSLLRATRDRAIDVDMVRFMTILDESPDPLPIPGIR